MVAIRTIGPRALSVATVACLLFLSGPAFAQASAYALRFFGTGVGPPGQQDRVRIAIDDNVAGPDASAPCDVGAGDFTIEFWLRGTLADNTSANSGGDADFYDLRWIDGNIVVDRDIFGVSERDWGVSIAGGFVRFGTGRGDLPDRDPSDHTLEGNVNVLNGQWHHVAVTRDAATGVKRIFVDGQLDMQGAAGASLADISYPNGGDPAPVTPWGPYIVLAAEKHDAGSAYPSFNGYMDEVRIWNTARTQTQILATMDRLVPANAVGLVGYYRFEAGSGTVVVDSSAAGSPAGQLIAGAAGNGEWVAAATDSNNTARISAGSLPPGFSRSTVVDGLDEPTVIEFLPDGDLLIGQRNGVVRVVEGGVLAPTPLISINVNTLNGERGLVGLALDPDFSTNGYLYAYYTTQEPRNRVGRFTVVGHVASPASEVVIWQNPELAADYHHGGTIRFGPDGLLYIATGDQFDAASAQDLGREHGKILRVTATGAIPPGNPFASTPGARPAIWALGLRNPFRFSFDPPTGRMFIGNVGGNSADSWEELNLGIAGANYGWPDQEGPQCFVSDCSALTFPIWSYQHNDPNYFDSVNQASITVGPVYRAGLFPAGYGGSLFVGDYANRWIRRVLFDGSGNVVADPIFMVAPAAGTIVDLRVGPDGALYYVNVGTPWSGNPDIGAVYRIGYSGSGNQPPVVAAAALPTQGNAPLLVQFSSSGTQDPDGGPQPLSYDWTFGDGNTSGLPNPAHTYAVEGPYVARLTVSDGLDVVQSAPIAISVGTPPSAAITAPLQGTTYRAGDLISFSGAGLDGQGQPLPAMAYSWRVYLVHLGHTHPFLGPLAGVTAGSFVIPTTGHPPEDTSYTIELTVTAANGLTAVASRSIAPVIANITFDTLPTGIPILLDGQAVTTPRVYAGNPNYQHLVEAQAVFVLGGTSYEFVGWTDCGQRVHSYVTPEGGGALTAVYRAAATPSLVTISIPADNRDADYNPAFGTNLGNPYDANNLCTGRDSDGVWQAGLAFPLSVPGGATITTARLRFVASYDNAGSPTTQMRGYAVASAAPFVAGPTPLSAHHPLTAAFADWAVPAWVTGQSYDSPDIAPVLQELISRPDWTSGNFAGFVLDGAASGVNHWRCFRNQPTGDAAELIVEYAGAGSAAGDFDFDGDLDSFDRDRFIGVLLGTNTDCIDRAVADLTGDGRADGADIAAFVAAMLGG